MDHKRIRELFQEYSSMVEKWSTFYLDSIAGYSLLYKNLNDKQNDLKKFFEEEEFISLEFQNQCSILYKDISNTDLSPISLSPVMKQGDVKKRVVNDGFDTLLLGNQCIVLAYSYWEEYLRFELGKALGVLSANAKPGKASDQILKLHVSCDFWGDIKLIRESIVHCNGMASSDISKCKVFKWFSHNQPIELTYERMKFIFLFMGYFRNYVFKLSIPPRTPLIVPGSRNC